MRTITGLVPQFRTPNLVCPVLSCSNTSGMSYRLVTHSTDRTRRGLRYRFIEGRSRPGPK